jgi:hypothetical protein
MTFLTRFSADSKPYSGLARAIAADLLRETPVSEAAPTCFACGREYTYGGPNASGQFCSTRCRDAYDAGVPQHTQLPTPASWIGADFSRGMQVAGRIIPRCDRCGGLCVERYRSKAGRNYCHWRCRDDKPRDCIVCRKKLYAIDRRGPYCSPGCANETRTKKASRVSGAKPQNRVEVRPVESALLEPVFEGGGPAAKEERRGAASPMRKNGREAP